MHDTVAVIGGGLAGLTAAIRLADRGRRVLLLESRPRLGGATSSFVREVDGDRLTVDTGQHVLLRCYTAHRDLLARLGVADGVRWQDRFDLPLLLSTRSGRPETVHLRRSGWLPAPLHLATTLAGCRAFTPAERARVAAAALALRRVDPDDPRLDEQSFGAWLGAQRQPARVIRRLWGLLSVAALNTDPEHASLALAARVLRTGLLDERRAGDIGIPRAPLAELHARPAARALRRLGASVQRSVRVRGIDPVTGGGFAVRTDDGEAEVDQVVLAVPHREAAGLVPRTACPDADDWAALGASPIVNVHVLLDRRVLGLPFAAVPDASAQWLFDKTAIAGLDRSAGQYLVTSVSDAAVHLGTRADDLRAQQLGELSALLPRLSQARVRSAFVTREPRATFRQSPGTAKIRPAPRTRLPGLVLAGAWTATGWPDTMEGAVRSGVTAADLLTAADTANPSATRDRPTLQEA